MMLEMLRELGLHVVEVEAGDIPEVCLCVTAADPYLIRRGAREEDLAALADWALLT